MSKSGFAPYKGSVTWSRDDDRWVIIVTDQHGGKIPPQEFFQAMVLADHLKRVGLERVTTALDTHRYVCLAWSSYPDELHNHPEKLIGVLRKHYAQFKGRPVKWALA